MNKLLTIKKAIHIIAIILALLLISNDHVSTIKEIDRKYVERIETSIANNVLKWEATRQLLTKLRHELFIKQ